MSAAAQITRANASSRTARPSGSSGIGSENTIGPAAIVRALAATLVTAMTGTTGPIWRLRAETSAPAAERTRMISPIGLNTIWRAPEEPSSSLSALMVVSEAAQSMPAEAASRTPARRLESPATAVAIPAATTATTKTTKVEVS